MIRMKLCMALLLLLSIQALNAQTTITGVLIDSISGEGEPYATLRVFKEKKMDQAVAMSLTDINGHFSQEVSGSGTFVVQIASIGKVTASRTVTLSGSGKMDLGTLYTHDDAKMLSGVEVVAHKPLVKMETDKMSYNVENDADSKSMTVLDMLRKVPLVTVDGQDNITVNGQSTFKVYVDGKPSVMFNNNPSQIFKSMPASLVKSIEVVTNPGARFDAEGAGGVLNIVMNHQQGGAGAASMDGYNGSVNANVGTRSYGGSVFFNAQKGKLQVSANAIYNHMKSKDTEVDFERITKSQDGQEQMAVYYNQKSDTKIPFAMGQIALGYTPDTMSTANVSVGLNKFRMQNNGHAYNTMTQGGQEFKYSNQQNMRNDHTSFTLSADYSRFLNAARSRQIIFSYQFSHDPTHNKTEMIYDDDYSGYVVPMFNNLSDNKEKSSEHTFQTDYTTPLGKGQTLNAGMKFIHRRSSADSKYYLDEEYREDMSSDYLYKYFVLAGYGEYDVKFGSWGAKAGLRYEHTWQDVEYKLGQGEDFTKNYGALVPSATLSYSIAPTQNLGLSYNMRISRPGISYLNPYVNRTEPMVISYGNTDLDIEKTHNMSLVYNHFASKWMLNATLRHTWCNDGIEQYTFTDENQIINTTYGNVVKRSQTNLSAFASWSVFKDTRLILNGGVGYNDMRSDQLDQKNHGWVANSMLGVQQTLPWKMNASVFWISNTRRYTLQGWSSGFNMIMATLGKQFFKDKLNVSIMGMTGLKDGGKFHFNNYSSSNSFVNRQFIKVPVASVSLNVTWNFGNSKNAGVQHQSKVNNDNIEHRDQMEQMNTMPMGGGTGGGMM